MNKRILDGAGVWKSDKIARIQPEQIRAEYANWIPLALANGSFEADTRRIWSTVYSCNRPDVSLDDAEKIKREFCRVGLLFLWPDEPSGKIWGYFTGIEKPGRLPAKSRLDKKHEPIGPTPPADALRLYIELTSSRPLDAALVSQWLATGYLGFGSGIGIGLGTGKKQAASRPAATAGAAQPVALTSALLIVNEAQDAKLADVYPWVNRPQEYKKMELWLAANRPGRKVRNVLAFAQNWFNKIPCPSSSQKGGTRGKLTGTALLEHNLAAAGYKN